MHGNWHEASSGIPDTAPPLAIASPCEGHAAPRPAHGCSTASVGKANWCLGLHCHPSITCRWILLRKTYQQTLQWCGKPGTGQAFQRENVTIKILFSFFFCSYMALIVMFCRWCSVYWHTYLDKELFKNALLPRHWMKCTSDTYKDTKMLLFPSALKHAKYHIINQ